MGYKPKKKIFNLTFVEHPGLEISIRGTSLGKILDIGSTDINFSNKKAPETVKAFEEFASRIVTWNMEHPELDEYVSVNSESDRVCARCGLAEGMAMPTELSYLYCLDIDLMNEMLMGWLLGMTRVALPKDLNINGGANNGRDSNLNGGTPTREDLMRMLADNQSPTE